MSSFVSIYQPESLIPHATFLTSVRLNLTQRATCCLASSFPVPHCSSFFHLPFWFCHVQWTTCFLSPSFLVPYSPFSDFLSGSIMYREPLVSYCFVVPRSTFPCFPSPSIMYSELHVFYFPVFTFCASLLTQQMSHIFLTFLLVLHSVFPPYQPESIISFHYYFCTILGHVVYFTLFVVCCITLCVCVFVYIYIERIFVHCITLPDPDLTISPVTSELVKCLLPENYNSFNFQHHYTFSQIPPLFTNITFIAVCFRWT